MKKLILRTQLTLFLLFFSISLFAQQFAQKGKVIDEKGESVIGANVQVKGTSIGTVTDIDGNFSIDVNPSSEIEVSYIGYLAQVLKPQQNTLIMVTLKEDTQSLDEIVVVGYGSQKKATLTGSVASISSEAIARIPSNDISASLVGIPGVSTSGGLRIRGNRSIKASNQPLIILDGMPYYEDLQSIDPGDVERIDVLKDASSTAIYGSQGANGVIIVSTKKGKEGKTVVSYDGFVGIGKTYYETFDPMSSQEYIDFKRESYRAAGTWNSPDDDRLIFLGNEIANFGNVNSDWVGEYLGSNRLWTSHTATISSGNQKTQYKLSMNYRYDKSRLEGSYNDKYFLNFDLNHQVVSFAKVGLSSRLYYNKNKNKPDPFNSLMNMSPLVPVYNEDGSYNEETGNQSVKNPFLSCNDDYYDDKSENWKAFINAYALFDIAKGLTFRTNFSFNQIFYSKGYYYDNRSPHYNEKQNKAGVDNNRGSSLVWNNILNYNKSFGKHSIDVSGIYEIQDKRNINSGAYGKDQALPIYKWYNMGSLMESKVLSSSFKRNQMISYVGRVNYNYAEKYLATITVREDGASQLSKENRWDCFPSIALAWRATEEKFLKNVDWLSNLKLRASYGITGNHAISPYATLGQLNNAYLTFNTGQGEVNYIGMEPGIRPTPDLKWEKTRMLNVGLDIAFLDNRIWGTFDYYKSTTSDLLNQKKLPYTSGFDTAWSNVGKTSNEGYEVALNTVPVETKDWRWTLNLTYYRNKEKLLELYDSRLDKDIYNGWWIGYPLNGVSYDFKQVGIWQENERDLAAIYNQKPGEVKVKDINGDGKIDANDKVILGTSRPKWMGSLSTTLSYKNFDLSMDCYAEIGALAHDGYSTGNWAAAAKNGSNTIKINYWTPENPSNRYPRPVAGENIQYISSIGYHKNDFLDIRNITVGYTFDKKIFAGALDRLRVYVSVNNPYRFWSYKQDGGVTFSEKFYVFGLNFQL